ncbi:TonB-dependent receptor [Halioxenophilus sp. WMMB6]|uniref:TonB-dependent receptor n=1 Tax=Halioxenophilus sp. WMMB6 TaxID=3073815 RepID=UPI00295EC699|nr:TonB-dependent receptor [Halioxenophilus sp. WMMB6]
MKKQFALFLATAPGLLSMFSSSSVFAQSSRDDFTLEEIVVTARRREERLQDVPISMSVLSETQIKNANLTNAADIALYTPSLTANRRFGDDLTSFAIRGFTQELRTTASVGVYFADVVSPRGSNSQVSGDGAGPGMLFDLENIQVLKGPQGTLFGRNTTGGAVVLTPKKPSQEFSGYVEATGGNFDLQQIQGVFNFPINDSLAIRAGVDSKQRDGYLNNVGDVGPDDFGNVDYTSGRLSVLWGISEKVENYTIATATESDNNGTIPTVTHCNTSANGGGLFGGFIGDLCQAQLDRQAAAGNDDFWDTAVSVPNPKSEISEWRVINTTTWEINTNVTLKNIAAYAELNTINNSSIWGTDYRFQPYLAPENDVAFVFANSGARGDGVDITDNATYVEEIQLQGMAFDGHLIWQGGLYYESTKQNNNVGQSSPSLIACDFKSVESGNISDWRCNDVLAGATVLGLIVNGALPFAAYGNEEAYLGTPVRVGSISLTEDRLEYTNQAIYAQATYDFSEKLSSTLGLRYTVDETKGRQDRTVVYFPYDPLNGGYFAPEDTFISPRKDETQKSEAPTWVIGVDYKPTSDALLYAKYSRGYRQGSVNVSSQPGLLVHDPEKVDTFEIGTKLTFNESISGYFNTALFYNDFRDQQLQNGLLLSQEYGNVGSTAIVNAGKSQIWGLELDTSLNLFQGFSLSAAYTYLNSEVKEIQDVNDVIAASGATPSTLSAEVGDELPFAPEHSAVLSANYRFPFSSEYGDLVFGITYVYTGEIRVAASTTYSPLGVLPDYEVVNFNLNWNSVLGSPVDLSLFVNNALEEKYYTYATGNYSTLENETGLPGQPRMYGARVQYRFGNGSL